MLNERKFGDDKSTTRVECLPPAFTREWLSDSVSLIISARGIGWEFGRGTPIAAPTRPLSRTGYIVATTRDIILGLIYLDVGNAFIHIYPGLASKSGGSIFAAHLPPLQRYAWSTYVTILTGITGYAALSMVFDIFSLAGVAILHDAPNSWPPFMNRPWAACSVRDFWARWHQLARRTFLVFGGIPGGWVAGRAGRVIGAFIASGLMHEAGMYPLSNTWDWRQPAVFLAMGVLIVGEELWTRLTGKRVGGFCGRLWTWTVLAIAAQPLGAYLLALLPPGKADL